MDAALSPADEKSIGPALAPLWVAFPVTQIGLQAAEARVAVFTSALHDLPLWAIREAVEAYVRGEVDRDNHNFAPSPAQVRLEAKRRLRDIERMRFELDRAESARVIVPQTEEELARRRARVAELLRPPRPMGEAAE